MTAVAVLLAGAALAHAASRRFGIPATPFLIVAGILLAAVGVIPRETLQQLLVLGVAFVLFVAGIEMSPRRVRSQRGAALRVGVGQFVLLGAAGVAAALVLGAALLTSAYLGLALAASSTLLVVRLLQQRKQLFEPFGRLVLGVLLVQDVLVILLIPLVTRLPQGAAAVAGGFVATAALVGLAFAFQRWVTPALVRLQRVEEELLLAALSVLFLFVGLAHFLGVPLAAGAFLAGVSLAPFPVSGITRAQLAPVAEFFSALFFIGLGALLARPDPRVVLHAAVLAGVVLVVTPLLVSWMARRAGFPARPALEGGLLLAQTSEMSLVLALEGLVLGQVGEEILTTVALVTVATMVLTPFLATDSVIRRLLGLNRVPRAERDEDTPGDHVLLLGCGSGGMPLLETLLAAGEEVVVVDDDPEVVRRLRSGEVRCIRGDATDPETLRRAGASRARLISSTVRRPRDVRRLLETVADVPVLVRVFEDEDAAWVAEHGGIPVMYSEAAAEEFLRWFDGWAASAGGDPSGRGAGGAA